jgi:hypothetical protein
MISLANYSPFQVEVLKRSQLGYSHSEKGEENRNCIARKKERREGGMERRKEGRKGDCFSGNY